MFTYKTADYKFLKTKKRKTNEILKEAKKLC